MQVAIPLYDRFTALDAVGPYEVLSRLPGAEVVFVAEEAGPVRADTGQLTLMADRSLAELPEPELVVVPGGAGSREPGREALVEWIRHADAHSRWTTSVCTGALLLAAAGLLEGRRATTHWLYRDRLRELGAEPVEERVVQEGKLITAAGVSAGIDMALRLAELEAGPEVAKAIQLAIEYDPEPPHDSGSPAKAPASVVELVTGAARRQGEL